MKIDNFLRNIGELKNSNKLDLSIGEDLSIALMNLVSLEEHSFFSYIKTKDEKFLNFLQVTKDLRKKLLLLLVKQDDSEAWCMSKHILASSMRLYEVGNRLLSEGKKEEAISMYNDSAELYGLFWRLNNKSGKAEKVREPDKNEKKSIFSSIKKLLECCKE